MGSAAPEGFCPFRPLMASSASILLSKRMKPTPREPPVGPADQKQHTIHLLALSGLRMQYQPIHVQPLPTYIYAFRKPWSVFVLSAFPENRTRRFDVASDQHSSSIFILAHTFIQNPLFLYLETEIAANDLATTNDRDIQHI